MKDKTKKNLALTIVAFWVIAFIVGILGIIVYLLVIDTVMALITFGLLALFFITLWAFTYIDEH